MATSSRPAWVAKISSLYFIPNSLIAGKHLALTFSKIMSLPVTGNFRPILTSICRFSASYKASYSFLKSSVIFSIRADSFFDAFVFAIILIFDGQTIEVPFPCPNERIATAFLNLSGSRDETLLAPLRAGWTRLRLCAHPSRKIHPPPRQTFAQRERPTSRKTGLPQVPTRPAPPPLRSPHPSLHSASKVSSLRAGFKTTTLPGAEKLVFLFSSSSRPSDTGTRLGGAKTVPAASGFPHNIPLTVEPVR